MFNSSNLRNFFFLFTIVILLFGTIYVFSPYIGVIFIGIVLVELFDTWYKYLKKVLRSEILASTIAGLSIILAVVFPLILMAIVVLFQANALLPIVSDFWQDRNLIVEAKGVLGEVNSFIARFSDNPKNQITITELQNFATKFSESVLRTTISVIESSTSSIASFVPKFFMLIVLIFSLFSRKDKLYEALKNNSPLEDRLDDIFIKTLKKLSAELILGYFFVAVGLGLIGGITFWLLGISAPAFWGLMMGFTSMIPVGAGLIWFPAVIYLIVIGEIAKGIILFLVGMLMSYVFDSFLRGFFAGKRNKLHPLVLTFSILGGLEVFGALGFLYGPLIVVIFLSMMEVYKEKYSKQLENDS